VAVFATGDGNKSGKIAALQWTGRSGGALCRWTLVRCFAGAGKKRERKVKGEKRKERERKKGKRKKEKIGGKGKNGLSIFLEIVIDNLYLLYYYRAMKIEDINYIIK
jgi:hypothetical protein